MSWEPVGFVFFSTLEFIAIYFIICALFRLKPTEIIFPALFIILLMDLQSFFFREDLQLTAIVPFINILLFVLLFTVVMRIPLAWSAVISVMGYFAYVLLQVALVQVSFGYLSVNELTLHPEKGYLLQTISSVLGIGGARVFYMLGGGFTFDFEKLRLKREAIYVYTLIGCALLLTIWLLYRGNTLIDVISVSIAFIFFAYYAVKKEKDR
ncbi:hypothetical protein [Paenibacillus sp. FSL L8-0506]|uniref:hypothetical protein n=1 Tax=Paenibacillus sp. FSL L8-0506 TaxID=2975335 RepID=UPI0009D7448C